MPSPWRSPALRPILRDIRAPTLPPVALCTPCGSLGSWQLASVLVLFALCYLATLVIANPGAQCPFGRCNGTCTMFYLLFSELECTNTVSARGQSLPQSSSWKHLKACS